MNTKKRKSSIKKRRKRIVNRKTPILTSTPKRRKRKTVAAISNPVRKVKRSSLRRSNSRRSGFGSKYNTSNASNALISGAVGGIGGAISYWIATKLNISKKIEVDKNGKKNNFDVLINHLVAIGIAYGMGYFTDKVIPGSGRAMLTVISGMIVGGYISDNFLETKESVEKGLNPNQWNFGYVNPYYPQPSIPYVQPQPQVPVDAYGYPLLYGNDKYTEELEKLEKTIDNQLNQYKGVEKKSSLNGVEKISNLDGWKFGTE